MSQDQFPPNALLLKFGKLQIGASGYGLLAFIVALAGYATGRLFGLW